MKPDLPNGTIVLAVALGDGQVPVRLTTHWPSPHACGTTCTPSDPVGKSISGIERRTPLTIPSAVPLICTLDRSSHTRGRTASAAFLNLACVPAATGGPTS